MAGALFTGILFIVLGLLVKKFPMLIAGYNTMPKEERDKIDISGYSSMMRNVFCVMGVAVILFYLLMDFLGQTAHFGTVMLVIIFGGIIYLFIAGRKYQNGAKAYTKKNRWTLWITLGTCVLVFGSIGHTAIPAKVSTDNEALTIAGAYGLTVPFEDISSVELKESLPRLRVRTNGLGLGSIRKGHFNMEEYGKVRLFFQRSKPPYIVIKTESNGIIILDRKTKEEALELYDSLPRRKKVSITFD